MTSLLYLLGVFNIFATNIWGKNVIIGFLMLSCGLLLRSCRAEFNDDTISVTVGRGSELRLNFQYFFVLHVNYVSSPRYVHMPMFCLLFRGSCVAITVVMGGNAWVSIAMEHFCTLSLLAGTMPSACECWILPIRTHRWWNMSPKYSHAIQVHRLNTHTHTHTHTHTRTCLCVYHCYSKPFMMQW